MPQIYQRQLARRHYALVLQGQQEYKAEVGE